MYNIYAKLKTITLSALFICSSAIIASACISATDIFINNEVDNLDGTCTYDVSIVISNTTTALTADLNIAPGSISNCNGGDCTDVAVSPGGTITATITKLCGEVVRVGLDGYDVNDIFCGQGAIVFTGLEPLPAEITEFTATQDSRTNTLIWKTSSEENTMAFQIQRSLDGVRDFETIGQVEAGGNSSIERIYEFVDKNPVSLAYYRLQTVDFDGSYDFTEVIAVERVKTEIDVLEVYPVPMVGDEITALVHSTTEGPVFIDLFDLSGRVLQQDRVQLKAGVNRLVLNVEEEDGNFYFFTIYNGEQRFSKKIWKPNLD